VLPTGKGGGDGRHNSVTLAVCGDLLCSLEVPAVCIANIILEPSWLYNGYMLHCVLVKLLMLTALHAACPTRRCTINNDAFLEYMGYERPFGTSVAILAGYLGLLHVLTYAAMVLLANREAR
jgi:hypothetical protein